ncbi:MAG: CBS domain-containing protein [Opitutaceae bacterium]|jgi:CBS domain-containing protein
MNTPLAHILSQKGTTVTTVRPSSTVGEAVSVMNKLHIGAVLVADTANKLLGIFTERDVLSRIIGPGADPKTTTVQSVMTTKLVTASSANTVEEAMALFMERRIRHLPVIDHGAIAGIISIGDINRRLLEENLQEARHLRHYIHGDVSAAI